MAKTLYPLSWISNIGSIAFLSLLFAEELPESIVCFTTMDFDSYFGIDLQKMMLVGPQNRLTNCLSLSENVAGSLWAILLRLALHISIITTMAFCWIIFNVPVSYNILKLPKGLRRSGYNFYIYLFITSQIQIPQILTLVPYGGLVRLSWGSVDIL